MDIKIYEFIEGAKKAKGLTVIIDVFRAFSTACYLFEQGVKNIIPVESVSEAFHLQNINSEFLLLGERNTKMVKGFNFGNSPTEILKQNLKDKTIVQTTSAGTRGLTSAIHADEVITGSFVNIQAIINYILKRNPKIVSLVAMGYNGETYTDEDYLCAEFIKNSLLGIQSDFESMKEKIRYGSGSRFFLAENAEHSPSSDFDLCLAIDRFPFVLQAKKVNEQLLLKKILI